MANAFKKTVGIAMLFFLPFVALNVTAQTKSISLDDIENSIQIKTLPQFPKANEEVSIRIESFSSDLNTAEIIWALDGKIQSKSLGKKDFSFTTGKLGTVSLVKIIIKTTEGRTIEKTVVVKPALVDLVWEANSYTPPFYKGKALYAHQSKVTIVAMPHMLDSNKKEINPKNLIYKWIKNGKVLGQISGYGKNSFSLVESIISNPIEIEVEVTSSDKSLKAKGEMILDPIESRAIIYENNPLYGIIYEKAMGEELKLAGREITLSVAPYFFSREDVDSQKINYDWNMNGADINSKKNAGSKTFRRVGDTDGASRVSVELQNENRELQSASASVSLNFGEAESNKIPVSF